MHSKQKKPRTFLYLVEGTMKTHTITKTLAFSQNDMHLNHYIFKKIYNRLLVSYHVLKHIGFTRYIKDTSLKTLNVFIQYYSQKISKPTDMRQILYFREDLTKKLNMIIFSKPRKQLFVVFFNQHPIFIFTGGLMRLIINEKKKSSRKIYKVSVSLIKLSVVLLNKKHLFSTGLLFLKNVGSLRSKILKSFQSLKQKKMINYVLNKYTYNISAQKLDTRRSVKKYIKKRFQLI